MSVSINGSHLKKNPGNLLLTTSVARPLSKDIVHERDLDTFAQNCIAFAGLIRPKKLRSLCQRRRTETTHGLTQAKKGK